MSRYRLACNCGWEIETNDLDTMLTCSRTHDETCPLPPAQPLEPTEGAPHA